MLKVVASGGSGYRSPISDRAMLAMSQGQTPQQVFGRDRSVGSKCNELLYEKLSFYANLSDTLEIDDRWGTAGVKKYRP